jgi:hypothetical protein
VTPDRRQLSRIEVRQSGSSAAGLFYVPAGQDGRTSTLREPEVEHFISRVKSILEFLNLHGRQVRGEILRKS